MASSRECMLDEVWQTGDKVSTVGRMSRCRISDDTLVHAWQVGVGRSACRSLSLWQVIIIADPLSALCNLFPISIPCKREKNWKTSKRLWIKWGSAELRRVSLSPATPTPVDDYQSLLVHKQTANYRLLFFFFENKLTVGRPAAKESWGGETNEWVRKIWRKELCVLGIELC